MKVFGSRTVWGIAAGILVLAAVYFLIDPLSSLYHRPADFSADTVRRTESEIDKPVLLFGMKVNHLHIITDVVHRNQRFADLLEGYQITNRAKQQLATLPREQFDFRKMSAGKKYTLLVHKDSARALEAVVYEPNAIDYVIFHFGDSLTVEALQRAVVTEEKVIIGVIGSSLSETIENIGISPELTNRFVDIFAWQVDFQRLQKGDRFKIIYDEQLVDNQPIGIGSIKGIYFEHFGNPYYAIPFDQGEGLDYFDELGQSLRKALLKYPIEFTRISSRYTYRRYHPVEKIFRPHLGTDFAAPMGTPIRTVGDGIVLEAQYKGNNGNYVKIRHNATYSTQYLHMSRIAAGIVPGARVRQGETIGFVGSTGLSTGPHLCYRFWKNGVQVDALQVELPPSQPVKEEWLVSFALKKERVIGRLDQILLPEPPQLPVY
jgi:murein DD-endopeptidase MepM/ murein hydrolase activator NlpD